MKIDPETALSLKAVIENDLRAVNQITGRLQSFAGREIEERDLATIGYAMHNLYNALENSFEQISRTFENHVVDAGRWHRELLSKMFLEIPTLRPAVLADESRLLLHELLRFRHLFRHSYDFNLDGAKLRQLLGQWLQGAERVNSGLNAFAQTLGGSN